MSDRVKVKCPCCAARLVVDTDTGAVLSHEARKGPRTSFEDAFAAERSRHERTEEKFGQAFVQQKKRKEILSKKFEEAEKKAKDSDKDYRNPLDYD